MSAKTIKSIFKLSFFAFFVALANGLAAQNVNGIVRDEAQKPVEGAYILNLKNNAHAHSNEAGFFTLNQLQKGDSIKVSLLGFVPKIVVFNEEESLSISSVLKPISLNIVLEKSVFELNSITIRSSQRAQTVLSEIDSKVYPTTSSQDILKKVPGLFIGQHAGGGKAEQMFLRGFDIDHGTDINISVDGMPVNMVSHAHGQGYADLHFLIPETVNFVNFGKGTYYADQGNFNTAGFVSFNTKDKLENSSITLESGQFNTLRTVGLFKLLEGNNNQNAYLATEYLASDGAFKSPQNFNRLNFMGKYSVTLPNQDRIAVSASHFTSQWNASGQIPQRAVDAGLISRFGAIDDTEGGNTQRSNLNFQYRKQLNDNTFIKNTAYFSQYGFELYSNFTFFLNDSINGDQIRQKEKRQIFGFQSEYNQKTSLLNTDFNYQFGVGLRTDYVDNIELSHTKNRRNTLENLKLGNINETNAFSYANAEWTLGKWAINPALRLDYFKFGYEDQLAPTFLSQTETKAILSPKLNFKYNAHQNLQFYLKLGKGFHANDTRVVVAQKGADILPAAYSADLGVEWKPLSRLFIYAALWSLYLEQEFVYVGDEGVVEPSGKTRRQGVDLSVRYQLNDWLFLNADANYTLARSLEKDQNTEGPLYIPLAPDLTATGSLNVQHKGWVGSYRIRYMKNRPANEDNSIVAKGYVVQDANINYQWKKFNVGFVAENIFNTAWNETQFATTTRLKNEIEPVEEIHFTPGVPFFLKGVVTFKF
jgi:TonB dependent receptor/TonB-dependent Receptor Plug Domain